MKALLLAWLAAPALAQSTATLKGVDVYRSASFGQAQAEALKPRVALWVEFMEHRKTRANAEKAKRDLIEAVRKQGRFAYVDLYFGRYLTSAEHSAFVTFDVVDELDKPSRMPFRAAPTGRVAGIDPLVSDWDAFNATGLTQRKEGKLSYDRPACPAYYCLYGSQTPELAAIEKRIVEGARAGKQQLLEALTREADPAKRAKAVYLLSYVPEGKATADLMLSALTDPDAGVRGAALEVLSDIATHHRDVFIESQKLIPALDFPSTTDRVKALAVLVGLTENPDHRPYLISRASRRLIELLKQEQPSVHDLAYTVLSLLSKETYHRRDYDGWKKWADRAAPAHDGP